MKKMVIPDLSGAGHPLEQTVAHYAPKIVSEKHAKKIQSFLPVVQQFFHCCDSLDLNKKYSVAGLESKIKGIDLLVIMDMMIRERENPLNGLTMKYGIYFNKENNAVGYLTATGSRLFETKITSDDNKLYTPRLVSFAIQK
jgi:hypothetical protein